MHLFAGTYRCHESITVVERYMYLLQRFAAYALAVRGDIHKELGNINLKHNETAVRSTETRNGIAARINITD